MAAKNKGKKNNMPPAKSHKVSSLQDAAEKKLGNFPPVSQGMKGQTSDELIHDLQVHQIELEMQADELRKAQISLSESRDQYLDLYEFAPLGYLSLTDTELISHANLTAAVLLGVDRKKLINSQIRKLIVPDDLEAWDRFFRNLIHTENKLTGTFTLRRGNGASFPARLECIRLSRNGEKQFIRVAISDISDIIKAQKELHESEKQIRLQSRMLDAVGDAVIAVDTDHRIIFWNEAATKIYGWKAEEVLGKIAADVLVPEISMKKGEMITEKLNKGDIWSGEYPARHRDGHEFPVYLIDSPVFDRDGNLIAIIRASHDISNQKLASEALQQSENTLLRAQELLEAVTKGAEVIIAAQDMDFRYIFFNQGYKEEIKRITGKDLALGSSMVELFAEIPEEQKMAVKEWSKVLKGENVNRIVEFGDTGGHRRVYHVLHTPLRDIRGTIIGAGEVAYDVTKQVQVEDALRETKEYLDNLITYANAPIIVWDPQFHITLFNRAFEHLTGRKAKEVLGQHLDLLLPESYLISAMDLIRKTMGGERWESVEIPILHKEGGIRTVLWNSTSIYGPDGKNIISTIAQGQDITDRKKIESEYRQRAAEFEKMNIALEEEIRQRRLSDITLKETLSLLNAALESTADGILVVDPQGKISSYNQNFVHMWNIPMDVLESGKNETVMKHVLPQLMYPGEFSASIRDLQSHPGRESFDMIEFTDGKIFERFSKPQLIGDMVVGRVWSYRDVTDRKRSEQNLVASLQEKEVLLREIHHRVKNNLQLISGLLDMTRMRSKDESTNSTLTDLMLKIQTMAQIHTRLYESKQFGKINLSGQIRDQLEGLSNIYSHKGHEISCELDPSEVFLPVDQAIPCALVVNEILSNAYKHAFKGRRHGTIKISALLENGLIRIRISDDGIGIPADLDINYANTLGLKLIRNLVQHQLKGSILINRRNGTEMIVEFPVNTAEK